MSKCTGAQREQNSDIDYKTLFKFKYSLSSAI